MTLCLLLLFTSSALGQFSNLATTDDGSKVYFVTGLRLQSEASQNLPPTATIYSVDSLGHVQRVTTPPPLNFASPVYDGNPQVSGDGSDFSYTVTYACNGGSSCELSHPTTYTSYLSIGGQPYSSSLGGSAQLSRSGRFVWNYGSWSSLLSSTSFNSLLNLQSGSTVQPQVRPANFRQALTSDGSVLGFSLPGGNSIQLSNSTAVRPVPTTETPALAIVNDAASEVIYEASTATSTHLRAVNLSTGADILIATRPVSFGTTGPSLTNDGTMVAYVAEPQPGQPAQAWLAHTDGTATRMLTSSADGVSEVLVAGLGTSVIAISGSRIVSIDVPTGSIQELIGVTPTCYAGFESLIPGSILPINGSSLAPAAENAPVPLPNVLNGVQVLMNGAPLPLLSIAPTQVWFQVPFDLAPQASVTVALKHSSLFEGCAAANFPVVERQPYLVLSQGGNLILAHQDFQSLVTQKSPVQPGEIVHAYAVGLGIVTPTMQTGIPTPVGQLFTLVQPFTCSIGGGLGGSPLNVLFAGLAPGAIGIYQVDVQMPSPLPAQAFLLNCGTPGNVYERQGGVVPVPLAQ